MLPPRWLHTAATLALALLLAACTTPPPDSGASGNNSAANNSASNNSAQNNSSQNSVNNASNNNVPGNNTPGNNSPANNNPSNNNPVIDSPTAGDGCMTERDCSPGELCVGADRFNGVEGYCTFLNCETHDDCVFPRGGTFCCSNFGDYRGCFREADGAVCGDEQGQQGDTCASGGQSDCAGAGHYCIDLYGNEVSEPFCAALCDPREDACPAGSYCYATAADSGVCVTRGDTSDREPCADDPYACQDDAFCIGAWTDDALAYCGRFCTRDAQCPEDEWCLVYPGGDQGLCSPRGGALPEGASCAEDRFACAEGLFCLYEGERYARCARFCERSAECAEGSFCQIYDPGTGAGICVVEDGRDNGEPCGDNPFACNAGAICYGGYGAGYNGDAFCVDECTNDPASCGAGFTCVPFETISYCLPDGDAQAGEPCTSARDCAADTYCVDDPAGEGRVCAAACTSDAECGADQWCTSDGDAQGLCWPRGDRGQGEPCADDAAACGAGTFCAGAEPLCFGQCDAEGAGCPDDHYCLPANADGQRWCYPRGTTPAGEACDAAYACAEGSFCVERVEDQGRCLSGCRTDADCLADQWCYRSRTYTSCLPRGQGETGEGCGADGFDCAEGHLCLYAGTPDAYCVEDCTGFPDRCGEGEVCRFIGWGLNICMPTGELTLNDSCAADPQSCDAGTICAGVGFVNAFCADLCTFDRDSCPEGTACTFTDGGLGVCIPPGFDYGDPLPTGGGPL